MKTLIITILLLVNIKSFAQSREQMADLALGSEITIMLDNPEFYSNNRIEWSQITPDKKIICSLSTHTYYDEDLVRSLKKITFTIEQTSFSDVDGKYAYTPLGSTWNVNLNHPNKSIPLISLSCSYAETTPGFPISKIEELTNGDITFTKKTINANQLTPIKTLMPIYFKSVKLLTPLTFTLKSTSPNSGFPSEFYAINGELSAQSNSAPSYCQLMYHWSNMGKDKETTLQAGTMLDQNYFSQHFGQLQDFTSYMFTIQSTMAEGLTINCRSNNKTFTSFSEIQNHLKGIIEIY